MAEEMVAEEVATVLFHPCSNNCDSAPTEIHTSLMRRSCIRFATQSLTDTTFDINHIYIGHNVTSISPQVARLTRVQWDQLVNLTEGATPMAERHILTHQSRCLAFRYHLIHGETYEQIGLIFRYLINTTSNRFNNLCVGVDLQQYGTPTMT